MRGLSSTLMDITSIDCPKANSTFVVDKKVLENMEKCLSPEIFPRENETYIKSINPNKTYNMPSTNTPKQLDKNNVLISEDCEKDSSVSSAQVSVKKERYL